MLIKSFDVKTTKNKFAKNFRLLSIDFDDITTTNFCSVDIKLKIVKDNFSMIIAKGFC